MKNNLLQRLRDGLPLTRKQQIQMIIQLSLPAILAQISHIVMQYIDASMVGQLGAEASASIGLVSSSTWLFNGTCSAAVTGFSVQVAQSIGAKRERKARNIMRQSFMVVLLFTSLFAATGALISGGLPVWLGGNASICADASGYFLIFALALPFAQLNNLSGSMLQASGNMKIPSLLHVIMCGLDVIFNYFFIYPSQTLFGIRLPGAGLGVLGAALGTGAAQLVTACIMAFFLLARSPMLHLRRGDGFRFSGNTLRRCLKIAVPIGIEQIIMCGAQVLSTRIVAPLGTIAIAANSFAVTAESLCYMPGFGISTAATTLIGQSIGAKRKDLTRHLGWFSVILGMSFMGAAAVLMYIFAPFMIGLLSPDPAVVALGATVLQLVAFSEPLYGAQIVCSGVFRGAGDTLIPSILNFCSMWLIRLPLSAVLTPHFGLVGVWIAMLIELCARGSMFLIRMKCGRWWEKA